jgi:hypothetical protein
VRPDRRWFVAFVVLFVSACGQDPAPSAPTPTPVALVRVDIDGPTQQEIGTPGGTLQLRALATLADGTRPDVTSEAAWSVTDPRVLAVSSRGLVTGLADGGTIVTATYRDRAGATNVRVGPVGGRPVLLTGVVVDAERGTPIADAEIRSGSGEGERLEARTDGNGFFSLGEHTGHFTLFASQFGYETAVVNLGALAGPTRVEVRLRPNPGDYVERRLSGAFTPVENSREAQTTVRISTRAGGVFDAIARSSTCGAGGLVVLFAENGTRLFISRSGSCDGARVRFDVSEPDVLLTIRGYDARTWELTFREPR